MRRVHQCPLVRTISGSDEAPAEGAMAVSALGPASSLDNIAVLHFSLSFLKLLAETCEFPFVELAGVDNAMLLNSVKSQDLLCIFAYSDLFSSLTI